MVLTAVVSGVVARDNGRRDEDGWLRAAYGSTHWSTGPEEWIARDFFQDRRGGVFVDVGSADAREGSNTYYLEAQLGWSGIAVDALAEYGPTYLTHRPKTQFFPLFVGDHSDDRAVIYVANRRTTVSSVSRDFSTFYADEDDVTARSVPTITLNDLLVKSGVTHVDFLSMDIELSEPMALAGFDLRQVQTRARHGRSTPTHPPTADRPFRRARLHRGRQISLGRSRQHLVHPKAVRSSGVFRHHSTIHSSFYVLVGSLNHRHRLAHNLCTGPRAPKSKGSGTLWCPRRNFWTSTGRELGSIDLDGRTRPSVRRWEQSARPCRPPLRATGLSSALRR